MNKVFTCVDHDSIYPVGVASVVIAKDRRQAKRLLNAALEVSLLKGYKDKPYTLQELNLNEAKAVVLRDGDY